MTCRRLCIPIVLALAYSMANGGSSPFNDVESESTTTKTNNQYETGSSVESNNYSTIPFSETITTEVNDGSSEGNMTDNIGDIVDRKENNGNISIEESDTTEDTSISVKILIVQNDRLSVLDLAKRKLLPPLRDEKYVQFRSIDYLYNESLIFYSANSSIVRAKLDDDFTLSEATMIVKNTGDEWVSLAVDWVNKELYWIEENDQRLMKSDLEGGNQKIVVQNSTKYSFTFPNNIAVDPCKGLVFFVSNYAVYKMESNGDIKHVELDGNNPGDRERGVRTIALDRTDKCIYISGEDIEGKENTHYLARVRYDGSGIEDYPMKGMSDIFSMDVFDGTLYLAEYKSEGVVHSTEHLLSVSTTISDKLSTTKLFVPWKYYQSIYNVKIYGPRIQTCRDD